MTDKCTNKNCESFSLGCDKEVVVTCEKCGECMNIPYAKPWTVPNDHLEKSKECDGQICPTCSHINYCDQETMVEGNNDVQYLERSFDTEWTDNGLLDD
jgi:hypothetical protein